MALIIPEQQFDYMDDGTRRFIQGVRADASMATWTLLHNVCLPGAPAALPGETVDILVNPQSAVLLISAHPQERIFCKNGEWDIGGIHADPYKQAESQYKALLSYLSNTGMDLSRTPIGYAVSFTNAKLPMGLKPPAPTIDSDLLATSSNLLNTLTNILTQTRVAPPADGSVGRGSWPNYRLDPVQAILILAKLIPLTTDMI